MGGRGFLIYFNIFRVYIEQFGLEFTCELAADEEVAA